MTKSSRIDPASNRIPCLLGDFELDRPFSFLFDHIGSGLDTAAHRDVVDHGRAHFDRAVALYDPAVHRPLATRFGFDVRVATLTYRSLALWLLGYPEAALADVDQALKDAREIGRSVTLMYALGCAPIFTQISLWKLRR